MASWVVALVWSGLSGKSGCLIGVGWLVDSDRLVALSPDTGQEEIET